MQDHKSENGNPQKVDVAAKRDNSTSNELLRPTDDTSTSLTPLIPPAKPVTPPSLITNPNETISNPPKPPPPMVKPPATDVDPDATTAKTPVATGAEVPVAASIHIKRALQPGDLIGARYEILSILGRGGMGVCL
jgi:hypothetical protein